METTRRDVISMMGATAAAAMMAKLSAAAAPNLGR